LTFPKLYSIIRYQVKNFKGGEKAMNPMGLAAGIAIGIAMDNLALGIAIGVVLSILWDDDDD